MLDTDYYINIGYKGHLASINDIEVVGHSALLSDPVTWKTYCDLLGV